jgi:hypothetical protein
MNSFVFLFRKIPLLFVLLFCFQLQAQVVETKPFVSADTIVKLLENQHQVKIYYNPLWYEGKELLPEILDLPLSEALSVFAKISGSSVIKLKSSGYVLVPQSHDRDSGTTDSLNYYNIGDIMNYGSKNTAVVKGTVINGSTGESVIGARVKITGISKSYETDRNGKFTMTIPVGEHTLTAIYPGFEENNLKVKVFSDGSLTIELYIKTIMLDEVSVTSVKIDQYYRRTKMSVMSFDVKTIKELPGNLGETDVIKGLSLLPGVQTTGEFGAGFNVRGGSSDQNLVLIEDVPVFNTSHLFGLTSIVNPDGITDATLYKGGIPVIYGERASSILSIRMENDHIKKTQVKGGIGLINSRLSVDIPIGNKLKVSFGGRTSYSDWMLKKIPDADLRSSSAGFNDFNLYLTWNISRRDKLTLFGYASNDNFSISGMHNYQYGNMLGSLNYSHRFNSKLYSGISAGVSRYEANLTEKDSLQPANAYKTGNALLYRSLKWNWIYKPSEEHVINFGANAFLYEITPGKIKPAGDESHVLPEILAMEHGLEWAAFVGDDYKLNDKVSIEMGLRYSGFINLGKSRMFTYLDGFTRSEETIADTLYFKKNEVIKTRGGLEPRVSVRYNLNVNSSLRMSYNRINQYVNLISNTSVSAPNDLWKLSDRYIKPLVSDQIAIGYFRDFKNKGYETSVELYYKLYDNVIDYKNGATIFMSQHIETELVAAEGQSFGVELYGKKNTGKFTGWVSYTLSKSMRRTVSDDIVEQINKNEWFPDNLDRLHNLVINGGYSLNKRWKFGFTFNYNTGRPVSLPEIKYNIKGYQIAYYSDRNKYKMPDYHRLDLSISRFESLKLKKKWKGYWTFSVINVYGQKNAYSIFYQRDRSPYNFAGRSALYKLYIIGRPLPTFTYNFLF